MHVLSAGFHTAASACIFSDITCMPKQPENRLAPRSWQAGARLVVNTGDIAPPKAVPARVQTSGNITVPSGRLRLSAAKTTSGRDLKKYPRIRDQPVSPGRGRSAARQICGPALNERGGGPHPQRSFEGGRPDNIARRAWNDPHSDRDGTREIAAAGQSGGRTAHGADPFQRPRCWLASPRTATRGDGRTHPRRPAVVCPLYGAM